MAGTSEHGVAVGPFMKLLTARLKDVNLPYEFQRCIAIISWMWRNCVAVTLICALH